MSAEVIHIEESLFAKPGADGGDGDTARRAEWMAEAALRDASPQVRSAGHDLLQALREAKVKLPVLPAVVTQALALTGDPSVSFREFEEIIRPDPVITARILKVANSPLYGLRAQVSSLRQAMMVLGTDGIRTALTQAVLEAHVLNSKDSASVEEQRRHSVAVAHAAQWIARLRNSDSVLAFTCGMLHDLGRIMMPGVVKGAKITIAAEDLAALTDKLHGLVGGFVLTSWGLPQVVADVAAWHHANWAATESTRSADALRTVMAAELLAGRVGLESEGIGRVEDLAQDPIWRVLGLRGQQVEDLIKKSDEQLPQV